MQARFVHTNLVARDWRKLAAFYCEILGCTPVYPTRDLRGPWLDRATGVEDAHIQGIHLRLPGHGPAGPTLEIFQYDRQVPRELFAANRPGFGHIAFGVDDVEEALREVVNAGGGLAGELVSTIIPGLGGIVFAYATDPEGNVIELQQWVA
jgi:catechol 2,3-dioxygenase-like lactoylglutathione lyase family enzyme